MHLRWYWTPRKPVNGRTVYTQRDVTGGEDLGFEPILFEGCPDSAYRRPSGYRGWIIETRGRLEAIKPNPDVFVNASQSTGGRIRTARSQRSPGRRNVLQDKNAPLLNPVVSLFW